MDIKAKLIELGLMKGEPTEEVKAEAQAEVKAVIAAVSTPAEAVRAELATKEEFLALKKTFEAFTEAILEYIKVAPTEESMKQMAEESAKAETLALVKGIKSNQGMPSARELGLEKPEEVVKNYGPLTLGKAEISEIFNTRN